MAEFRWIIMSAVLMLVFECTEAAETRIFSLVGDDVTLPFENVIHDQGRCENTTWFLSDSSYTVTLFEKGQIHREAGAKPDRLRVTEKCSLVIKKVTHEDVGRYACRQLRSGQLQGPDSWVYLSVVNMTERQDSDQVTWYCSVWTYEQCKHTVKWSYEGNEDDFRTSEGTCSASVTFPTSRLNQKSKYYKLLKCEVTDVNTEAVHPFTFSPPQSSGDDETPPPTTTATSPTTTATSPITTESPSTTGKHWTSVKMSTLEVTNQTASDNDKNGTRQDWWKFAVGALGVAALLIITVAVIRWRRTKGNKTQMDENVTDPEDRVAYASITYTKKKGHKAKVHVDDGGDAVTYSTLKASSSSSAEVSADPRHFYASVKKPKK